MEREAIRKKISNLETRTKEVASNYKVTIFNASAAAANATLCGVNVATEQPIVLPIINGMFSGLSLVATTMSLKFESHARRNSLRIKNSKNQYQNP